MRFLGLTLPSLADNLALDEALLLEAESGAGDVLRVWEWPSLAVVLGAGGILAQDVEEMACQRDGVPLGRRASGGGTVLLGPGCLLYSLVLAYDRDQALGDVTRSYRYILERMCQAFDDVLPGCRRAGSSDLVWGERKFSGNAQQRKRRFVLHHGTLLYGFDLELITRYLKVPERQPDYRYGRAHAEFVMNLPLRREDLQQRLQSAWDAREETTNWPEVRTGELVAEKYGQEEWVRRR